jgi:hypothetical protein
VLLLPLPQTRQVYPPVQQPQVFIVVQVAHPLERSL